MRTLPGPGRQGTHLAGLGLAVRFDWPNGIAVDAQGVLYVADNINSTVRCITRAGVTTLAGHTRSWDSTAYTVNFNWEH